MTPKRAEYLQGFCHDEAVRIKASRECGKLIPDLKSVETLYGILEEILKHVRAQDMGSG